MALPSTIVGIVFSSIQPFLVFYMLQLIKIMISIASTEGNCRLSLWTALYRHRVLGLGGWTPIKTQHSLSKLHVRKICPRVASHCWLDVTYLLYSICFVREARRTPGVSVDILKPIANECWVCRHMTNMLLVLFTRRIVGQSLNILLDIFLPFTVSDMLQFIFQCEKLLICLNIKRQLKYCA